jgi:hypothetical protein
MSFGVGNQNQDNKDSRKLKKPTEMLCSETSKKSDVESNTISSGSNIISIGSVGNVQSGSSQGLKRAGAPIISQRQFRPYLSGDYGNAGSGPTVTFANAMLDSTNAGTGILDNQSFMQLGIQNQGFLSNFVQVDNNLGANPVLGNQQNNQMSTGTPPYLSWPRPKQDGRSLPGMAPDSGVQIGQTSSRVGFRDLSGVMVAEQNQAGNAGQQQQQRLLATDQFVQVVQGQQQGPMQSAWHRPKIHSNPVFLRPGLNRRL